MKPRLSSFLLICFFSASWSLYAQSSRDVGAPAAPRPVYQATKAQKRFQLSLKSEKKQLDEVAEFRKRVYEVHKQKYKQERKMRKPQYSNPAYFGHKRPPKKRPPGKMKYCKECQMVH